MLIHFKSFYLKIVGALDFRKLINHNFVSGGTQSSLYTNGNITG